MLFSFNAALRSADAWFMTIIDILSLVDKIIFYPCFAFLGQLKSALQDAIDGLGSSSVVDLEVRFIVVHRIMAFNYNVHEIYSSENSVFGGRIFCQ